MRREHRDELLRSCLAINALLRGELGAVQSALRARKQEAKYNPNWRLQPRAPAGTAVGGRWVEDGGSLRVDRSPLRTISGDPMDGADAAMFGEMFHYELTRSRYTRALEETQDPRERMRIANDRALLARHVFQFSGEEERKIYTEEMRTRRDLIAFGGTDLSERSFRLRERANIPVGDGRNVAVIEYRDANGNLHYIETASRPGRHAEESAVLELRRLRVPPASVTRIYSDRQPCSDRCRPILRPFTNAYITWAVDWPDDDAGQTEANNTLARQIRSYRRMELQGTLPMQLWRYPNPNRNVRPPRRRRSRR